MQKGQELSPFPSSPGLLVPMQNRWPALQEGSHESALRSSECKVQLAVPWRPGAAGSVSVLGGSCEGVGGQGLG